MGPSIKPGFQLLQRHGRELTGVKSTMRSPPFCFCMYLLLLLGHFQGVSVETGLSPPECRKQTNNPVACRIMAVPLLESSLSLGTNSKQRKVSPGDEATTL